MGINLATLFSKTNNFNKMPKVFIAIVTLLCIGCYNPKKFDVTIEHKTGKVASMRVTLNPKYIKVIIKNRNVIGTSNSRSYKRDLSKEEAIKFYTKINMLRLDTLKSTYMGELENNEKSTIEIERKNYNKVSTNLQNAKTPATDSLLIWVDKLITNENFKYRLDN